MIVDRMEYAEEYYGILPHLKDAVEFITANPDPGEGKHAFPGGFVMCQTGETRALPGDYEMHRKYIDIQVLREGREILAWNRKENMQPSVAYDEGKDKEMVSGEGSVLELKPGMFAILYPSDAHKACRHLDGEQPCTFSKYVVKLEV
ncbi:MAG: YhcH/YjgK/YiaL family protein [Lachnospiraceae bacterium]|nr:YhcH/YjgK/YiaL family protein [Lachnospiraceae bacterium]